MFQACNSSNHIVWAAIDSQITAMHEDEHCILRAEGGSPIRGFGHPAPTGRPGWREEESDVTSPGVIDPGVKPA